MSEDFRSPLGTPPFCPTQTDFLTFRGEFGFAAVDLDLVEGFQASDDPSVTFVHLTTGRYFESQEAVPVLVARYAAIKKLRYAKDARPDENGPNGSGQAATPPVLPQQVLAAAATNITQPPAAPPPPGKAAGIWSNNK